MAVHERQNSVVHRTRVKQRGSRVKPEVATVLLARGVFGGDRRMKTETEREQSNAGEFPKTLTPSASVHWYHAYPWTRTYNSLYLSLNTFSLRPLFTRSRASIHLWPNIAEFFLSSQRLIVRIFLFLFYEFHYLHRNLTIIAPLIIVQNYYKNKYKITNEIAFYKNYIKIWNWIFCNCNSGDGKRILF